MDARTPISPIETENKSSAQKSVPWGPVAAILVTIVVYFGSQIIGGVIVYLYPVIKQWSNQQASDWLAHSVYAQFAFVVVVEALTLWLLWLFLRRRRARAEQLGIKKPRLVDIAYALSGFAAYFFLYIGITALLEKVIPALNSDQKQELGFSTSSTGLALWLVFISLVLLPPIVEEIVARGFLYTGLRSKLPKIVAAIITSILFGAAHLQFGSGNALLWTAAADTFILSMVLVYLRDHTDSLWPSILLHMLKNGIAFVGLFILHLN
jgi:membrane protease YdiL (CAAX protease family)